MDFGKILNDWEEGKQEKRKRGGDKGPAAPKDHPMKTLLSEYSPDADILASKHEKAPQVNKVSRERMRRKKADLVLDLHGMTGEEAERELTLFIRRSYNAGARKILIIHGKGNHTKGESVLKPLVKSVLEMSPYIGDTGTPERRDGGSGATWAAVRQRSL